MYGSLGSKLAIGSFSMYSALESAAVAGRTEKRTELLIVRTTSTLRLWECIFALFHVAPPPVFHLNFCSYRELRSIFDFPHFPLLVRPRSFSLSGGILRARYPPQNSQLSLIHPLFQRVSFAAEFPSKIYGEIFVQNIALFLKFHTF